MFNVLSEEMKYPTPTSIKRKKWVTFICVRCGKNASKWYDKKLWNCKCEHCSKGGFTTTEFIEKALSVHKTTYDYSKTSYTNKRTMVTIVCKKHGDFLQRPSDHLSGAGCVKCGDELRGKLQQLPSSVWLERLKQYPNIKVGNTQELTGSNKAVNLICVLHGKFTTTLNRIGTAKYLCGECARVSHQLQSFRPDLQNETATLYYVYIPSIDMYKLGVTVQPLNKRMQLEFTEILTKVMRYEDALKLEHQLHNELKDFRYQGTKKLLKVGNTELYKVDISIYLERALA